MPIRFVCAQCGLWEPFEGRCAVDNSPLEPTDDPLLGSELGSYRLVRLLGRGGMGRVYAAVHPTVGSRVAIKLINAEIAQEKALLDRFFSEARAVNLIRHENIVKVIDFVQPPDGRAYIVMELITGQTLRQLAQGNAALGGLVHVMIEVLAGLAAAHAIGIVHRDLKPDNIFVTANGHAKLLDFGIAKLSGVHAIARTQTGVVLGTPEYMAPEMVLGETVDGRADLYAIGLILYELVVGKRPFTSGTDFDIMRAHVEKAPTPPREVRPDVPESLERVILRALEKRPADRFENATAMQKALRRVAVELVGDGQWKPLLGKWLAPAAITESLTSESTKSAPTVRAKPPRMPAPRKRAAWILPVVLGIAAFATTAIAIVATKSSRESRDVQVAVSIDAAAVDAAVADADIVDAAVAEVIEDAAVVTRDAAATKTTIPPTATSSTTPVRDTSDAIEPWRATLRSFTGYEREWRAFVPKAYNHSYEAMREAWLVQIVFHDVEHDGSALNAQFWFAGRANRNDDCSYDVTMHGSTSSSGGTHSSAHCKLPPIRPPRCTLREIRARTSQNVQRIRVITYTTKWNVDGETFADDCKAPAARAADASPLDIRGARQHARKVAADANLVSITITASADGTVSAAQYLFRSIARAESGADCAIIVTLGSKGDVRNENVGCSSPFTTDPDCTPKQVIERAKAERPSIGDGPHQLMFSSGTWHFANKQNFSISDNCR